MDTRIELVAALEKLPSTPSLEDIIADARAGEYHDYKNTKWPCGKIAAYSALYTESLATKDAATSNELLRLANQIKEGEYDELADEEDKAMMRKDLPEAMWDTFGLRPK